MRLITRTLVFVIVILAAFWFTAENARELVVIDLAFLRVRASLPLVVFGSILAGMGLSLFAGWRAERRLEGRRSASRPRLLRESDPFDGGPGPGEGPRALGELRSPGLGGRDEDVPVRDPEPRSGGAKLRSPDEPETMEWS